jgi:xanthine dehydrogenase accessory factor
MTHEIFNKITELAKAGKHFAVATIVHTTGSTPRKPGAKMIIMEDGNTFGTIGGGCAESGVVSEALETIRVGEPRLVEITLEEEERGGVGMLCGGSIRVYIEAVHPMPRLLMIGGGHLGVQIAKLGKTLGFSVTVLDPVIEKEDFPEDVEFVRAPVEEGISKVDINPNTFVVIATRHKYDEEALKAVVNSNAAYIGMVGSKTRVKLIFQKLTEEGIPMKKLKRVHAPIGLDIGAQTPEEIAVSVMAEIIRFQRDQQATGQSLSKL